MDSHQGCIPARERCYSCSSVAANLGPAPDSGSDSLKGGSVSSLLIIVVLKNSQLLQATPKSNFLTAKKADTKNPNPTFDQTYSSLSH